MIYSLVQDHIERTPDAVAAVFEDKFITYAQLGIRANQLAHRLLRLGIGAEKIVGVCLERSIEMVVTLLAIQKAGGAYIWLDPAYPHERLAFVIKDAQPSVVVTNEHLLGCLPPGLKAEVVCYGRSELAEESSQAPAYPGTLDSLTYVIFTSGSTGQPKGVAMGQRVLVNLLEWQLESWTPPAAARTLQFSSLNFDVSFQEIFSTLSAGGTLILTSEEQRRDFSVLLRLIRDLRVERIFLPFVALQQLARAFEAEQIVPTHLRDVITAGEQLQITPQIRRLFEKLDGCVLHNQYGPAECHVVTALTLRGKPGSWPVLPSIGQPIANARIHILDEEKAPAPDGTEGEIYIGGEVLARGYLNRELLTAERFIPDPFSKNPQARLYRTGDLGKVLPDGNIQYLGRNDQQVKIRGVRVELGEIEATLAQHPAIAQAVVTSKEVSVGDIRLFAYFVPKPSSDPKLAELRDFLRARLPSQLIPSTFVPIAAMPLTSSGKIDRRRLPETAELNQFDIVAAQDPIQQQFISIWEEELRVHPIGIRDSFFDLGGDSLVAIEVCLGIERKCGLKVPLSALVQHPTIEGLVNHLRQTSDSASRAGLAALATDEAKAPFFCLPSLLNLARHLGSDRPFYGLSYPATEVLADPETTTESIAADCIRQVRSVQATGPYYLGGYSYGGVVIVEVARQLAEQGEEIALLAMLDPDPPCPARTGFSGQHLRRYLHHFRRLGRLDPLGQLRYLAQGFRNKFARLVPFLFRRDEAETQMETFTRQTEAIHRRCPVRNYRGRATIFLAQDTHWEQTPGEDPRMEWREFIFGPTEIIAIPGDHELLYREPYVGALAEKLDLCLKKARPRTASAPIGAVRGKITSFIAALMGFCL